MVILRMWSSMAQMRLWYKPYCESQCCGKVVCNLRAVWVEWMKRKKEEGGAESENVEDLNEGRASVEKVLSCFWNWC